MQGFWQMLYLVGVVWLVWLLVVNYAGAVMHWYKLRPVHRAMVWPLLAFIGVFDMLLNFTVFSLVFWRWPPSLMHVEAFKHPFYWTLLHRLAVYKNNPDGWRQRWALFLCEHVLDPFKYGYCF